MGASSNAKTAVKHYGFVLVRVVALVYLGLGLLLYFLQAHFIFLGSLPILENPKNWNLDFEAKRLSVGRETTAVWFIPAQNARGVVLLSHGNAGNMGDRGPIAKIFHDLGLSVCMYDYGGYGESSGTSSETRCYEDARAVWQYLTREKSIDAKRIILYGHSLGCGPTIQLASEVQPGAVVVESGFRSVAAMAQRQYPVYPVAVLVRHRFDNESKIASVHAPIMVIHSREDEMIPFAHGEALFKKANDPKTFLEIRGGHNSGTLESIALYRPAWQKFLDQYLPAQAQP